MKHITFTLDEELVRILHKLHLKYLSPDPIERQVTPKLTRHERTIAREILPLLEQHLDPLDP